MSYFVTIQYPYNHLTVTLSDDTAIISTETISKFQAMSSLIPTLQTMLTTHDIAMDEIACIGVNTGPGPFNTLRSIIATANGISFAKQIPLIGCNGLELMLQEQTDCNVVVILDAFGSDVYFAIKLTKETVSRLPSTNYQEELDLDANDIQSLNEVSVSEKQGYDSIETLINELNSSEQKIITFVGNGAIKHKEFISNTFAGSATFKDDFLFATSQALVNETYSKYSQGLVEKEIFPLYFESPVVKS